MCIIAAKPAGVAFPSDDVIRNMWENDPDGAGYMYPDNGKVRIVKGFMKLDELLNSLTELRKSVDLDSTAMVLHFRITTHGGTCPANCHPFPVTRNVKALQSLKQSCSLGVAHNGIITSVSPRKGISDTMEYIATQLAPLYSAMPAFYRNADALELVENAIGSKMAILTPDGDIYTIGKFETDNGVLYSNGNYKYKTHYYGYTGSLSGGAWKAYDAYDYDVYGDYGDYGDYDETLCPFDEPESTTSRYFMWLDSLISDDIEIPCVTLNGVNGVDVYDFLVDSSNDVYLYDYAHDSARRVPGAVASMSDGSPILFSFNAAELLRVGKTADPEHIAEYFPGVSMKPASSSKPKKSTKKSAKKAAKKAAK